MPKQRRSIRLSKRQRASLLLLLLPLMWLFVQGWLRISAELMDYQTITWAEHWQQEYGKDNSYRIPEADYLIALQGAQAALAKQPTNGLYAKRAAAVADWYVIAGDPESDAYPQAKQLALEYFRQAAVLRPNWPEAHFDLALAKSRQQQMDDEFAQALSASLTLGPWEPRLQLRVLQFSWFALPRVSPELQLMLAQNLQRMERLQTGKFWQEVGKQNAYAMACPLIIRRALPPKCDSYK